MAAPQLLAIKDAQGRTAIDVAATQKVKDRLQQFFDSLMGEELTFNYDDATTPGQQIDSLRGGGLDQIVEEDENIEETMQRSMAPLN